LMYTLMTHGPMQEWKTGQTRASMHVVATAGINDE